jgi:hypothetical protein
VKCAVELHAHDPLFCDNVAVGVLVVNDMTARSAVRGPYPSVGITVSNFAEQLISFVDIVCI